MRCRAQAPSAATRTVGFTLVELIVAMSVLFLIVVVVSQVFGSVSGLVNGSNINTGSLDAGEAILGQISLDVSRMVLRGDVDYDFTKQNGNDRLSFYCRTSGLDTTGDTITSSTRPLAVVSYQVGTPPGATSSATTPNQQLNYGALQIDWAIPAAQGLGTFAPSNLSQGVQTQLLTGGALPLPTVYATLATEVVRFEYSFLLKTDPNNKLLRAALPTPATGVAPIENIAGLLVGIVVVDPRSRLLFPPGADVKLAALCADSVDGQDLLSSWSPDLTPAQVTQLGIPVQAVRGMHIYQRYIPFNW